MSYREIVISTLMEGIPDHDARQARAVFERLFEILPREAAAFRLALPMARLILVQYIPDDVADFCDALVKFCEIEVETFAQKRDLYSGLSDPYADWAADATMQFLNTYTARSAEQQGS